MAGKEQDCVPEISRHFSGAAKLFPRNQFITNPPAFLAVETEVSSADCFIRGFRIFLEDWRGLVPFQCDTLTVALLTTEQAALVSSFLSCDSARFELLCTADIHFLSLQNFKLKNSFPLSGISEALTAQAE